MRLLLLLISLIVSSCYMEKWEVKDRSIYTILIEKNDKIYEVVFAETSKSRKWENLTTNSIDSLNRLWVFYGVEKNELDSFEIKPDEIFNKIIDDTVYTIYRYYRRKEIYNYKDKSYLIKEYKKNRRYIEVYLLNNKVVKILHYNPVSDALP